MATVYSLVCWGGASGKTVTLSIAATDTDDLTWKAGVYDLEMVSAWAHRRQHKRIERFINWIFNDSNHCAMSYLNEMRGTQNAQEYRDA